MAKRTPIRKDSPPPPDQARYARAHEKAMREGRQAAAAIEAERARQDRARVNAGKTLVTQSPYRKLSLEEQARVAMSSLRVVEGMLGRAEDSGFLLTECEVSAAVELLWRARTFLELLDPSQVAFDREHTANKGA